MEDFSTLTDKKLDDLIQMLEKEKDRREATAATVYYTNLIESLQQFSQKRNDDEIYIKIYCEEVDEICEIDITRYFSDIIKKMDEIKTRFLLEAK